MANEASQGLQNAFAYLWEYADAAARTGATGFTSDDVGKLARQLDDNTLWMLTATTPTWVEVGGTGGGVTGFATPSIVLGTAAGAGAATTVIRSDSTIVAFDATAPVTQDYGDSAATGAAAVAARRDHKHGMPAAVTDATIATSDVTTNNVSISKHGWAPKAPNDGTKYLDGTGAYTVPAGTGMANPMTTQDDIIVGGSSGTPARLAKGSDSQVLTVDPSTHHLVWKSPAASTDPNHAYYQNLAALLEPGAIEQAQIGAFSYAINSSTTKWCTASFNTRLGASGRFEVRDPHSPVPLRGVTMTGLGSDSAGVFLDATLPTYTSAYQTYFDRLNTLATSSLQYIPAASSGNYYPLLPGPYGTIIIAVTNFDSTWLIGALNGTNGWNLANEVSDTVAQRNYNRLNMAVNKNVLNNIKTGTGGVGGVLYYICPSNWGVITDATSYTFRDDFMGATLDTTTNWTRAQSTAGNVEIQTLYQWCKAVGDGTWGHNGAYSQTGVTRANGKVFMCDVFIVSGTSATDVNLVVGFSDGAGQSYTNFSHGLDFTGTGALQVFENGTSRGGVGSGYAGGVTYRVRITLGASNNATYEIQSTDGTYGALGSATWTNITPGTSSSSTTPVYAGFTTQSSGVKYVGDVKIY